MKNYNEMADDVLRRIREYNEEQQKNRRKVINRTKKGVVAVTGLCLTIGLLSIPTWKKAPQQKTEREEQIRTLSQEDSGIVSDVYEHSIRDDREIAYSIEDFDGDSTIESQDDLIVEQTASKQDDKISDFGLEFSIKDVTTSGLTLVCTPSEEQSEELMTGRDFKLFALEDDTWTEVPMIIQNAAWQTDAIAIETDQVTEIPIDWEWLYGNLPTGMYKLSKSVMELHDPGDYEAYPFEIEFGLLDLNLSNEAFQNVSGKESLRIFESYGLELPQIYADNRKEAEDVLDKIINPHTECLVLYCSVHHSAHGSYRSQFIKLLEQVGQLLVDHYVKEGLIFQDEYFKLKEFRKMPEDAFFCKDGYFPEPDHLMLPWGQDEIFPVFVKSTVNESNEADTELKNP